MCKNIDNAKMENTSSMKRIISHHTDAVWAIAPVDDDTFLSGSLDGTAVLWNINTAENIREFNCHPSEKIYCLQRLSNNTFASASSDNTIKLWNTTNGHCIQTISKHSDIVYSLSILDNNILVSQSGDSTICLWNIATNIHVGTIQKTTNYVSTVVTTPGKLIICEDDDYKIGIWSVNSELISKLPGHNSKHIRALAFKDDKILATGSCAFDIKLWDITSCKCTGRLNGHQNYVNAVLFKDNYIFSASGDKSIKVWDIRTYNCVYTEKNSHTNWIQGLGKTNNYIISASGDKNIGLWPVSNFISTTSPRIHTIAQRTYNVDSSNNSSVLPAKTGADNYLYYIISSENGITCNITCNDERLNYIFFHSIIDTLYASGMVESGKIEVWTNFKQDLRITFNAPSDENVTCLIINFIDRLRQMSMKEIHENIHALWFYTNDGGDQILNVNNYPNSIKKYLKEERETFSTIVQHNPDYAVIVEIGCGELENISVARDADTKRKYIGIDFDAAGIVKAQNKIKKRSQEYQNTVKAICLNVLNIDISMLNIKKDERPLLLFPFNLIGNIAPISLLISRLRKSNLDCAISIYKNSDDAIDMRKKYYTNCGYKNIEHETDIINGVVFTSEEKLYTVAYDCDYLTGLFSSFGYNITCYDIYNGHLLHAKIN